MTEQNVWDDESPSNHVNDTTAPLTETGPSLDEWAGDVEKTDPPEPTPANEIDWTTFDSLPVKERQTLLGVRPTGVWGKRSREAYKEARGE